MKIRIRRYKGNSRMLRIINWGNSLPQLVAFVPE